MLREKQHLLGWGMNDAALPCVPEPRRGAQEGALSPAAGSDDQQAFPWVHREGELLHERPLLVRCLQRHVLERQTRALAADDGGPGDTPPLGLFAQGRNERVQTLDAGCEATQAVEVVDEDGE